MYLGLCPSSEAFQKSVRSSRANKKCVSVIMFSRLGIKNVRLLILPPLGINWLTTENEYGLAKQVRLSCPTSARLLVLHTQAESVHGQNSIDHAGCLSRPPPARRAPKLSSEECTGWTPSSRRFIIANMTFLLLSQGDTVDPTRP